jgi:hypothetical protein
MACRGALAVTFGGVLTLVASILARVGAVMLAVFGPLTGLGRWARMTFADTATADAVVTSVTKTNTRVNKVYVREFAYRFEDARGAPHEGRSYDTSGPKVGATATVEYARGAPELSRLRGQSVGSMPPIAAIPQSAIGVVGLALLFGGVLAGRRNVRLLRIGEPARGRLIAREPTGTKINNQRVWKLTFAFVTADGRPAQAIARSHQLRELLDEAEEPLLYDPKSPARAAMLDAMPGNPRLDAQGNLVVTRGAFGPMVLPVIAILAWGVAIALNVLL